MVGWRALNFYEMQTPTWTMDTPLNEVKYRHNSRSKI